MFSIEQSILVIGQDFERRFQHRRVGFNRVSATIEEDIRQMWGPYYRVSNSHPDIKAAKKLASVTARAFVHAQGLLEVSNLPPSILSFWMPNLEGSLLRDLERLAMRWTQLKEKWNEPR